MIWLVWMKHLYLRENENSVAFHTVCSWIDGHKSTDRTKALARFKNDDQCKILVAPLTQASCGLDLAIASRIILAVNSPSSSMEKQCLGRVNRLSQKKKKVYLDVILMEGSLEDALYSLDKPKELKSVIEGLQPSSMDERWNFEDWKIPLLPDLITTNWSGPTMA